MRNTLLLITALAVTILCWGVYGPVLQWGQMGMRATADSPIAHWRPFICVGLAYFLIGVIVPALWLHFRGETGDWTIRGIIWSLAGGALGAIGALGVILAFTFGGRPIYVMPLVFGGAPVVNAFLTIYRAGRIKEIGPWFLAGLIMVALGAVIVLITAPHAPPHATASGAVPESSFLDWIWRLVAIVLAIVSWGAYGPVLHNGQAAMHHSRLRPLLCVGLAYFAIAVVVPSMILAEVPEPSLYRHFFSGTLPSLAGGAFGAIGALGIILAFNFGGRPVFVMPLVFGGAPVINTFFAMITQGLVGQIGALFLAGLMLVIAGAAIVLVLGPRGEKSQPSTAESRGPQVGGSGGERAAGSEI
jgi:hypothetical protein